MRKIWAVAIVPIQNIDENAVDVDVSLYSTKETCEKCVIVRLIQDLRAFRTFSAFEEGEIIRRKAINYPVNDLEQIHRDLYDRKVINWVYDVFEHSVDTGRPEGEIENIVDRVNKLNQFNRDRNPECYIQNQTVTVESTTEYTTESSTKPIKEKPIKEKPAKVVKEKVVKEKPVKVVKEKVVKEKVVKEKVVKEKPVKVVKEKVVKEKPVKVVKEKPVKVVEKTEDADTDEEDAE